MTALDTPTAAAGRLSSQLAACLGADHAWDLALSRLVSGKAGLHLAILTEPFCSWLLDRRGWVQLTRPRTQEMLL